MYLKKKKKKEIGKRNDTSFYSYFSHFLVFLSTLRVIKTKKCLDYVGFGYCYFSLERKEEIRTKLFLLILVTFALSVLSFVKEIH